jgi:AraC family transcriptional activator of pobA
MRRHYRRDYLDFPTIEWSVPLPRSPLLSIPVFKLYGETAPWPTLDGLHCESIAERSRLHGWEIQAHRHVDLVQLLYVQGGSALLKVEDQLLQVSRPTVQFVPALSVHTFKFSEDVRGQILTLAQPALHDLASALPAVDLAHPACHAVDDRDDVTYLDGLFAGIGREYRQHAPGRQLALQALVNLLMVWLARKNNERTQTLPTANERGREHLQAFLALVEQRYREHWSIACYAEAVGVSPSHLNAVCRSHGGLSALQVINERLLLEARRCLVYTEMTVTQVADSLGFSEPAYFSRFFKRGCAVAPKDFRRLRQESGGVISGR